MSINNSNAQNKLTNCTGETSSRIDFELFKSNVCHRLKEKGDIDFIIDLLEKDEITKYYKRKRYQECLYLLAMLDYISRVNDVPIRNRYEELRHLKLKEPLFPAGILILAKVNNDNIIKEESLTHSIPEFMRFNIVENDIRSVRDRFKICVNLQSGVK